MDQTPSMTRQAVTAIRPRRFNVVEYHRMAELGILGPDERTELIDGEIIETPAAGGPHIRTVNRLVRLLAPVIGDRAELSVQNSIRLDDGSEPEPDVALLRPPREDERKATPRAAEVLLLVEVADSSRTFDRARKRPAYARSGIPEMWIVDLDAGVVEVCRHPGPDGYGTIETAGPGKTLQVAALPGIELPVDRILD